MKEQSHKQIKGASLRKHMYATYLTLRYGLAAIALFFPMLLYLGGRLAGIDPQNSMSAYYFASPPGLDDAPMRVWFVGLLFGIGTCLILYRGFSNRENWLLNLAGLAALCVAVFPMPWDCGNQCPTVTMHGTSATILFLCIAAVSIWCSRDTLEEIPDLALRRRYQVKYYAIAAVMIATPFTAFVFATWLGDLKKYTFAIETAGILCFAYYWWTKSDEIANSNLELVELSEAIKT